MSTILLVITNCFCEAHESFSVKVSFWSDIQIPVCREGSEEAGKCPGKAHGAAGGGSHRPPLGKTWHPTPEGECCHSGQQGAQLPWWSSWWDSLNCTTAKTICNFKLVRWIPCYFALSLTHIMVFKTEIHFRKKKKSQIPKYITTQCLPVVNCNS